MSNRRRLAFVLVTVPVAFYAYACSSDSGNPAGPADGGGPPGNEGGGPGPDGGGGTDSSIKDSSTGDSADAADGAVAITCIGNPLFPDGGTPDGGAFVDSGVAQIVTMAAGGTFLDGAHWVSAGGGAGAGGFLVYSEFTNTPQLHRVAADGGAPAIFRTAGLGAAVGPIGNGSRNGWVLTTAAQTTAAGTSVILQTAPDGGAGPNIPVGPLALSPNDLVVGKNGSIYFTDPRYQTIPAGTDPKGFFATLGDGGGVTRVAQFNGENPNGIALSPDGTKLYVGFTTPKRIDSYPVNPVTGAVTNVATPVVTAVNMKDSPDGIAVDVGGNLWVAEAFVDGVTTEGRVEVFKPNGDRWGQIVFPNDRPTRVAFGGPGNKTVFITVEKGVYAYTGRCAGIP